MTTLQLVDPAEHDAAIGGTLAPSAEIAPGVWTLPAEFGSSSPALRYTLSYLLFDGQGGVHIINPGVDTDDNWGRLVRRLAELGRGIADVRTVIVTHLHFDHLGMAARVRRESGAQLVLHRFDQAAIRGEFGAADAGRVDRWGVPPERRAELAGLRDDRFARSEVSADRLVEHGEVLELAGIRLEVIWTPGHSYGSICLRDAERKLIFTGDHVLPLLNPGLGLGGPTPSNPISDYLDALDRIAGFDDHQVCPGHGYRFYGLAARCAELRAHHLGRAAEVAAALDRLESPTVWRVAAQLYWSLGWKNLSHYLLASALAQTELHIARLGRASELEMIA